MFTVTLVHLAPDLSHAQADLDSTTFTGVDDAYVLAALDSFRGIDPLENAGAEPHVVIESPTAKLLVRTGQGRLLVYNARNTTDPFVELDPAGVLRLLGRPAAARDALPVEPAPVLAPAPARLPHRGLAIVILLLAIALNGYTAYSFFHVRPLHPAPAVTFVSDPPAAESLRTATAGRYATGSEPGDRVLEITADGRVRFLRLTAAGRRPLGEDTYRVARRDDHSCLVTSAKGIIDIRDIYTVVYFHDTYRRR